MVQNLDIPGVQSKQTKIDAAHSELDKPCAVELQETLESQFMVPTKTLTESCTESVLKSESSPKPENVPNFGMTPASESVLKFETSREEMVLSADTVSKPHIVPKADVTQQTFNQVSVIEELAYETSKSKPSETENVPRSHTTPEPESALKYNLPRTEMVLSPEPVSKQDWLAKADVTQKTETYQTEQVVQDKNIEIAQSKKRIEEGAKPVKKRSLKIRHSKSMSDKSGKTSVHRSKTISERELKSTSSDKPSKDDIRSILMKSPETNLDDLLMENVDYLSDIETNDPWGVHKVDKKAEPGHLREGLHMRARHAHSKPTKDLSSSSDSFDRYAILF
jgi:hypothetical protein